MFSVLLVLTLSFSLGLWPFNCTDCCWVHLSWFCPVTYSPPLSLGPFLKLYTWFCSPFSQFRFAGRSLFMWWVLLHCSWSKPFLLIFQKHVSVVLSYNCFFYMIRLPLETDRCFTSVIASVWFVEGVVSRKSYISGCRTGRTVLCFWLEQLSD